MARCKVCGRILTNAESIANECGPVCQARRPLGVFQLELRFDPLIDRDMTMLDQYKIVKRLLEKATLS